MTSDDPAPDRTIELGSGGEQQPNEPPPALIVVAGRNPGTRLDLGRGAPETAVIGRDGDCDLVLESPVVSGRHARVVRGSSGFTIEDDDSTNGVRVNGRQVPAGERHELEHGDAIQLSDHLLLFVSRPSVADRTDFSTIHIDSDRVSRQAEALLREFESLRGPRTD